jgi:hypothetical protein
MKKDAVLSNEGIPATREYQILHQVIVSDEGDGTGITVTPAKLLVKAILNREMLVLCRASPTRILVRGPRMFKSKSKAKTGDNKRGAVKGKKEGQRSEVAFSVCREQSYG